MSLTPLFLKALGVGVAVAAPVGPMSLLCMRRTLASGWRQGLAVGLGIALGDAAYGLVAGLGLASVSAFMLAHQKPMHLAAGLVFVWLGVSAWRQAARSRFAADASEPPGGVLSTLAGALLLTLANPLTILMFAAVFAALAPSGRLGGTGVAATVAGVFTGSLAWWCGVVGAVSSLRHVIGPRLRAGVDRGAGLLLGLFGLIQLIGAL